MLLLDVISFCVGVGLRFSEDWIFIYRSQFPVCKICSTFPLVHRGMCVVKYRGVDRCVRPGLR